MQNFPTISAIVAMSENRVIGNANQLLWHMPADLKHFKELTIGHPIIMGRKTFEAIGRPLPQRTNIIISHNPTLKAPGCIVTASVEDALLCAAYSCWSTGSIYITSTAQNPEILIIGGAQIYTAFLPFLQRIYLTIIHHHFIGDTVFPVLDEGNWTEISREEHSADEKNLYPYTFIQLERIADN